jgi:hypothetical protein
MCLVLPAAAGADNALKTPLAIPDAIYKGVVGKALDAVPMDPERRVLLQRTNAVASGTLTGRTLSVWAGLTNPILLVGGLVWGLFAASNIKANEAGPAPAAALVEPETADSGLELRLELALLEDRGFPPEQDH